MRGEACGGERCGDEGCGGVVATAPMAAVVVAAAAMGVAAAAVVVAAVGRADLHCLLINRRNRRFVGVGSVGRRHLSHNTIVIRNLFRAAILHRDRTWAGTRLGQTLCLHVLQEVRFGVEGLRMVRWWVVKVR